jgi:glucokinase
MSELLVGIDIGGTKIATSAARLSGDVIARTRRPTGPLGDPRRDVARIAADLRQLLAEAGLDESELAAVGVSAPGPLDPTGRRLIDPPNLAGWQDVPLVDWLEEELGVRVHLDNDANAAALAEWQFGAGRGFDDVVYLTMSTGIGAGLVMGGRLQRGAGFAAGEVGHMRVCWESDAPECSCGRRGCLEAFTGGACWTRRLRDVVPANSAIAELAGGAERVTPEHVVRAARAGDPLACSEMDRWNRYLARGVSILGSVLAPQVIILGTIAVAAGEELCFAPLREAVREHLWDVIADNLRIVPAELGDALPDRAGLGVALAALQD